MFYANDTSDKWNSSLAYNLTVSEPPIISIQQPFNTTYVNDNNNTVWANLTLNEVGSWCGVVNDTNTANLTMTNSSGNYNYQFTGLSDATHTFKFYCNDTVGNMNTTSIVFTVNTSLLTECQNLNTADKKYFLNQSIIDSNVNTCMDIKDSNITLDCQGNTIDGIDTDSTFGIDSGTSNKKNTTIKNCIITDWNWGIHLGIPNNTITNNTFDSNSVGIFLGSSNNAVANNTCNNNSVGMHVQVSSFSIFTNNIITSNDNGVNVLENSNNNTFINSIINNNGVNVQISQSNNNTFINGSIASSTTWDYMLFETNNTNFIDTNFTSTRTIYFEDIISIFNYNNQTADNIWLKTKISVISTLTRTLLNWNQTLMSWNDTNSTSDITANYNLTGMYPSEDYYICKDTVYQETVASDANGDFNFSVALTGTNQMDVTNDTNICTSAVQNYYPNISQSMILTSTADKLFGGIRNFIQPFSLSDIINKLYNSLKALTQSLSITNILTKLYSSFRSLTQILDLTDILNKLRNIPKILSQSLAIDTTPSRFYSSFKTLIQSLQTTELLTKLKNIPKIISQTISVTNIIDRLYESIRELTQILNLVNITSRLYSIFKIIVQKLNVTNIINKLSENSKQLTQVLQITDILSRLKGVYITLSQTLNISTIINKIALFFRNLIALFTITHMAGPSVIYNITIYVDGVDTLTFENNSQPYNMTVYVLKSGFPLSGATIEFKEKDGTQIFAAKQMGATTWAQGNITTGGNGYGNVTIIPTGYGAGSSYNISINIYDNEELKLTKYMKLTDTGTAEVSHSVSVPNSNQIADTLTKTLTVWSYVNNWIGNNRGREYSIIIDSDGEIHNPYSQMNVSVPASLDIYAYGDTVAQQGVKIHLREKNGNTLFLAPQTGAISIGEANATTDTSGMTNFTIVPTGYGASSYNVTMLIYDENNNYLNETYWTVDTTVCVDYFATGDSVNNINEISDALTKELTIWSYVNDWLGYGV